MNLEDKIKIALEQGKVEGAKKLASILINQEHKAEWLEEKQAEYDLFYPSTRDETDEEYDNRIGELDYEDENLIIPERGQVAIDYSEDENYVTYSDWINETRLISEAVEAVTEVDDEGFETIVTPYQPEVTELVRPYISLEVTDEMIEAKFLLCGYDYKAKRKAEYPSIETYIDGIVKGDEEQVQNYINECLAVKAKYPKPIEE